MVMYIPDVDIERLERRLDFLKSRAEAHESAEPRTELNDACRATLLRDAAAIAILLEQVDAARQLLGQSGRILLEIGVPAGASYIALSSPESAEEVMLPYDDVIQGTGRQSTHEDFTADRRHQRPFTVEARQSPRQVFSLMQAQWLLLGRKRRLVEDEAPLRESMYVVGGYPVGSTGLSIDSYSRLTQWMMSDDAGVKGDMPADIRNRLSTIASTRVEHLRAGMRDRWQWRLVGRPAELLDLDAIILMTIAFNSGVDPTSMRRLFNHDVPLEEAPIQAAMMLRGLQSGLHFQ